MLCPQATPFVPYLGRRSREDKSIASAAFSFHALLIPQYRYPNSGWYMPAPERPAHEAYFKSTFLVGEPGEDLAHWKNSLPGIPQELRRLAHYHLRRGWRAHSNPRI